MTEYINKCTLSFNGQEVDDFKAFTHSELEVARQINLMNKTGHVNMTARHKFVLDYTPPLDADEYDFEAVDDGTVTVDYGNGRRKIYTGVKCLTVGEEKLDGENEVVVPITFGAARRRNE